VLFRSEHNFTVFDRGDYLPEATKKAIDVLDNNTNGFFLMVEASQIDWGGHANNTGYIVAEMLDLDKSIAKALEFASKDGQTLIIVTSDHETGGMAVNGESMEQGIVKGKYTSRHHTACMVPVFAIGPGAENFIGIYENSAIFDKMKKAINF
jgi:alkaline phosphatase